MPISHKAPLLTCILAIMLTTLTACSSNDTNYLTPASSRSPSAQQLNDAAQINIKLGLYYLQQHNLVQAKTKLLLALAQAPNNVLAHDAFGYFLETSEGDFAGAEKYYRQALTLALHESGNAPNNDSSGIAHNNYGAFLYRQHRCTGALTQFDLAASNPNYLNTANAHINAQLATACIHT